MPVVTSSVYMAYYTSELGPEPFYTYNVKIKATTSHSSQSGQENPPPVSQQSLKCQYYEGWR